MPGRSELPFVERVEVLLIHGKDSVVAQYSGDHVEFPAKPVSPGESLSKTGAHAAEVLAGARGAGTLENVITVDNVWHPNWANNSTKRKLYRSYQGERVHIMVGKCTGFTQTSAQTTDDAWTGSKTMGITRALALLHKESKQDHQNAYAYHIARTMALKMLRIL